jgi:hypothetical protein
MLPRIERFGDRVIYPQARSAFIVGVPPVPVRFPRLINSIVESAVRFLSTVEVPVDRLRMRELDCGTVNRFVGPAAIAPKSRQIRAPRSAVFAGES